MRAPGTIEKTEGWQALVDILKDVTQVELAGRTDLRQSALSDIVNLHKKANVREVVALSKEGIAPELWTKPLAGERAAKGAA